MQKIMKFEYKTIFITSWRNEHNTTDDVVTKYGMEG